MIDQRNGINTMKRIKWVPILFLLFLLINVLIPNGTLRIFAASESPSDVPELPDYVWGQVMINGSLVQVGTNVSASCEGVIVAESSTVEDGWYDLEIPADDPGTPGKDGCVSGEEVAFGVENLDAEQTKIWSSGGNTRLDLSAEGFEIFLPLAIK